MKAAVEYVLTIVLALSAVVVAASVARSAFFGSERVAAAAPAFIPEWEEALGSGISVSGDGSSSVTVVALMDFECPACAAFHATLNTVRAERLEDIRVVYFPYALEYHRFALPAARASDCANEANAFERWTDVIFQKQDSLGLKSWGSYAMEAGIADTAWIASCARRTAESARIKAGHAFGDKIGLTGTPAVLVNGWYLKSTPNIAELNSAIEAVLNGDPPQDADRSAT